MIYLLFTILICCTFYICRIYKKKAERAEQQYAQFFNEKLTLERSAIEQNFRLQFLQWKDEYEKKIRVDAVIRSQSSTVGKITEHLIPYFPEFEYNPVDCRFLGSPIDILVFKGLDKDKLEEVIFLEIKTGQHANLTTRERQLRDIIKAGKVSWKQLRIERKDK